MRAAVEAGEPRSVGLIGNAADILPDLLGRGAAFDVVTDQTSAHDPLNGYIPAGLTLEEAADLRRSKPQEHVRRAGESMAAHCRAMVGFAEAGAEVFDYGNNLRAEPSSAASPTPTPIRGSSPPTSGRCSARAGARSASWPRRSTTPS